MSHAALTAVSTYHNDNARTGQYITETVLTPANVNPARFGKLYSYPLDGYVYAQPLYMPQVAIPGNGVHNVVVVATQHDSVYAFDADSSSATPLWRVNFLNPDAGITSLTPADVNASDIVPEIGITSTPVIDVASNTIYVVAATKENGAFYHRIHALDLASGAEKFGGPQPIQATYPGAARESTDGVLAFDSRFHLQRAALLLDQGPVVCCVCILRRFWRLSRLGHCVRRDDAEANRKLGHHSQRLPGRHLDERLRNLRRC